MATRAEVRIHDLYVDLRRLEGALLAIRGRQLTPKGMSRAALIRLFEDEITVVKAELAGLEAGRR